MALENAGVVMFINLSVPVTLLCIVGVAVWVGWRAVFSGLSTVGWSEPDRIIVQAVVPFILTVGVAIVLWWAYQRWAYRDRDR